MNPAHKRRVAIITALIYAAIIAACFLIARWVIGGLGERAVALVHDGDVAPELAENRYVDFLVPVERLFGAP